MKLILVLSAMLILSACSHAVVMNDCARVEDSSDRWVCVERMPWKK